MTKCSYAWTDEWLVILRLNLRSYEYTDILFLQNSQKQKHLFELLWANVVRQKLLKKKKQNNDKNANVYTVFFSLQLLHIAMAKTTIYELYSKDSMCVIYIYFYFILYLFFVFCKLFLLCKKCEIFVMIRINWTIKVEKIEISLTSTWKK